MKTIYLSSILKDKAPFIVEELEKLIDNDKKIKIKYLDNTKDIWIRDLMPIKTHSGKYIQYTYNPDYLKDERYSDLKTNASDILPKKIQKDVVYTDIVLDGGNFVKLNKKAIMTNKIYKENLKYSKKDLDSKIKNIFELNELIIIPKQPYDIYGHSDSMVRWIDDSRVFINDFQCESKSFNKKLIRSLERHNLQIEFMNFGKEYFDNNRKWAPHMNYLKVNNLILLPYDTSFGLDLFVNKLKDIFPECTICIVDCSEIIKKGGALHCISWDNYS